MVREPIVAGILYPSEPLRLRKMVQRLLMESPALPGKARALILPFAHYDSVGPLIAAGLKRAAASPPKRILLVAAPSRSTEEGLFLPSSTAFDSPLGALEVDTAAVQELLSGGATRDDLLHLQEHVLELHLPFLAHLFPEVPILPILVHVASQEGLLNARQLLQGLSDPSLEETLVIVSSNISSYGELRRADFESRKVLRAALAHDYRYLLQEYTATIVSGAGPLALLCAILPANTRSSILARNRHTVSSGGATFGVEYASIAFDVAP